VDTEYLRQLAQEDRPLAAALCHAGQLLLASALESSSTLSATTVVNVFNVAAGLFLDLTATGWPTRPAESDLELPAFPSGLQPQILAPGAEKRACQNPGEHE
jgi:hypothetical protein